MAVLRVLGRTQGRIATFITPSRWCAKKS